MLIFLRYIWLYTATRGPFYVFFTIGKVFGDFILELYPLVGPCGSSRYDSLPRSLSPILGMARTGWNVDKRVIWGFVST